MLQHQTTIFSPFELFLSMKNFVKVLVITEKIKLYHIVHLLKNFKIKKIHNRPATLD
jgi:hypothetical protein